MVSTTSIPPIVIMLLILAIVMANTVEFTLGPLKIKVRKKQKRR